MRNFFKGVRKHIAKLDVGHLREQYELVSDELSHAEKLLNALKEGFIRLDARRRRSSWGLSPRTPFRRSDSPTASPRGARSPSPTRRRARSRCRRSRSTTRR